MVAPATVVVVLVLMGAFAALVRFSFMYYSPQTGLVETFTLNNYVKVFESELVRKSFLMTFRISIITTLASLILGYPLAYYMARTKRPVLRSTLVMITILPLMMDAVVRMYGWIVLLGSKGLVNVALVYMGLVQQPVSFLFTESAIEMGMIHEYTAFVALPLVGVIRRIPREVEESAYTLGANPINAFLRVTFPLSLPGVVAGSILVFCLSMSSFVAPLILGGGRVLMLATLLRDYMFVTLNWPVGAAIAMILAILVLSITTMYSSVVRKYHAR